MERKWSNADVNRFLGNARDCYLASSADPDIREGAASGGATTQILLSLLESKQIDGALVWTMGTKDGRPYATPLIATNREALLGARTSIYVATYFARDAMPLLQAFDGKVAVMTLPCDASFLRKRMQRNPELAAKIAGIFTLFCGHNSLPELTEIVCKRHGFEWQDLKRFSYRTGSWRGTLTMEPHEGETVTTSTRQFTHFQNLHYFSEKKCQACFDHFGFDADLSLGDSWTLSERKRDIKPTVCVIRTDAGARLFAASQKDLNIERVTPEHVLAGNSRGLLYHYNVSARAQVAAGMNRSINDRVHVPASLLEKLIARLGVSNALWTWRNPDAKSTLAKRPFIFIKAYIYFFKGLQEFSSYFWRQYPDNRQISLIGATLTGNQGAAAMLETSIGEVRKRLPDANFVIHSYFPEADKKACLAEHVRIVDATPRVLVLSALPALLDGLLRPLGLRLPNVLMPASLRELRNSAVLLDISGISLADGREKFLPFNLLCTWPAMLTGTPVVKLSQAMGPAKNLLTRMFARFLLKRSTHTFARGAYTAQEITDLVPEERMSKAADIAFLHQDNYALLPQWSDRASDIVASIRTDNKPAVAISVSAVVAGLMQKQGKDYCAIISAAIDQLLKQGCRIIVFPNAGRENTDSIRNNDIPLVTAVREIIGEKPEIHYLDQPINTAGIRSLLKECDALMASRFHAMVAGLSLAVPTLVLGWSHKYQEVMSMFGTEEHYLDWSGMTPDNIVAATNRLLDEQNSVRQQLRNNLQSVLDSSASQFNWLNEFLNPETFESDA
ncbi:MAG: Coenzyme F420 hydrogenase/dehydrogenase, beta subunit C-terminal domain [Gammaproteobacteria bacterium]